MFNNISPKEVKEIAKARFDALHALMSEDELERMRHVPKQFQMRYMKSLRGQLSPRDAIAMKCIECHNWSLEGAKDCHIRLCPLHQYRPGGEKWAK